MKNKSLKKPSLVWVIIGFAVTIYLFATSLDYMDEMWHMFVLFIIWDISSLSIYFNQLKAYKRAQEIANEIKDYQTENAPLANPAKITIVRDKSFVGSLVSYNVYLNGNYAGEVKNGKELEIETSIAHNIVTVTDSSGAPFAGEKILELNEGEQAEIHVKAGAFVKNR